MKQPLHDPLCVSGFVTTTLTAPAACAVVVPVMLVGLTMGSVSADPPNETVAPVWNPLPATVTLVPPPAEPLAGAIELTVGAGARYVKQPVHVALWLSGFVTTTLTVPAACAPVVPVMLVELVVETVNADPPSDTVAPVWKPVPVIVTAVPPAIAPVVGANDATVGAGGTYVKQLEHVALCPSGFVTATLIDPAACAVVVPVIVVALMVATVSADPPNETVAPVWNPLPATLTDVPPALGPLFGVTEVIAGAATYVKQSVQLALCASGFVTTMLTGPVACAVVTPVIDVGFTVDTVNADPANETVAPAWKFVPATVTEVPPALGPLFGVTEETVGAATYVKQPVQLPLCVSGLVTITFTEPAARAVVVPVIVVALMVETVRVEPPKLIVAPVWNPLPLMVTAVPPTAGPLVGATELTVGAAAR
ncbi:MAG TPA: hypothetical protein VIP07_04430 [Candidatus Limnocylindria bacterium]